MPSTSHARSGDYKHRILLLTNTTTKDSFGQTKHAWTPSGRAIWCAIEPEFRPTDIFVQTAAAHKYEQRIWFRTRHTTGIDRTSMRLRHAQPPAIIIAATQTGAAGVNAQQTVRLTGNPTGGTFTLTYSGQTTSAIAYNASAATVLAALQALSNIGDSDITVAGVTGSPWIVTFQNTLGAQPIALMTANSAGLTGGTTPRVSIATTRIGVQPQNTSQTITIVNATGGTFTLTYNGQTTAAIAYNASAAALLAALQALSNVGDTDVQVTGANGGPYTVTFQNALGAQAVALLTANSAALTSAAPTDYEILASEDPTGHNRETRLLCREVQPQ